MKKLTTTIFAFITIISFSLIGCAAVGDDAPKLGNLDGDNEADVADGDSVPTEDGDNDTNTYHCPGLKLTTGTATTWLQGWSVGDSNPIDKSGTTCECSKEVCDQRPCSWDNPPKNEELLILPGTCAVEGDYIAKCIAFTPVVHKAPVYMTPKGFYKCTHDGFGGKGDVPVTTVDGDTDTSVEDGDTTDNDTVETDVIDGDTTDTDTTDNDTTVPKECDVASDCDDHNLCTASSCVNGACIYSVYANGTICDTDKICVDRVCQQRKSCDDGNPCTGEWLTADNTCHYSNMPEYTVCGNGLWCRADVCVSNTSCDDHNTCTSDSWAADGHTCINTILLGTPCDDGDPTTIGDTCSTTGTCVGTKPIQSECAVDADCNDNNSDTTDTCKSGSCVFQPKAYGTCSGVRLLAATVNVHHCVRWGTGGRVANVYPSAMPTDPLVDTCSVSCYKDAAETQNVSPTDITCQGWHPSVWGPRSGWFLPMGGVGCDWDVRSAYNK